MSDIITVSSSEDEEVLPPRKRIKPAAIVANLPNVTLTKISKKNQDIVVLCSDDEDKSKDNFEEGEISLIDDSLEGSNLLKINSEDSVQIINESVQQETKFDDQNESIEINDIDEDFVIETEIKNSCKITKADSEEESSGKENKLTELTVLDVNPPCSSNSSVEYRNTELLDTFLKVVEENTKDNKYSIVKEKCPLMLKYYNKCGKKLGDSDSFKNLLTSNINKAKQSPASAVISFNEIFLHLKGLTNAESIYVETKNDKVILKKLEKTIKKLIIKIQELEDEEVDFDQEENSAFIKLSCYHNRLDKVNKKYCELLKKNPHSGRLMYAKLDFVDSEFNEINRAISKKYKNNFKFPSYYEMEVLIRKVVRENSLQLSESKIKEESKHCFIKLGELLQKRRRKELYDSHHVLLKDSEDPANDNAELNATLENNFTECQQKIEKIVAEFVSKEGNKNEDKIDDSEEDSDQSNYVDSEDDYENEEVGKG